MKEPIKNPGANVGGGQSSKPILRTDIEEAQKNTNSSAQAARWLNVSYKQYKKYAELYGIFERHKNPMGIGIAKGFAKRPTSIPLRDILSNKHPHYSRAKLKNRLIARKKLVEECSLCGFKEQRITDKKIPLILSHKDGNNDNYVLENLELLCYNCMFLTTGAPSVVYRNTIKKAFEGHPIEFKGKDKKTTEADKHDSIYEQRIAVPREEAVEVVHTEAWEDIDYMEPTLTEDERQELLNQLADDIDD